MSISNFFDLQESQLPHIKNANKDCDSSPETNSKMSLVYKLLHFFLCTEIFFLYKNRIKLDTFRY